jgi:metal-sulfur cluster biosynthetic enzyme
MINKKEIMEKLSQVVDPELGINIVDLGFIYEVNLLKVKKGETQKAEIRMTLTTPACPMADYLVDQVKQRLDALGDDIDIKENIVFDPPWSPEKMSEKAKAKLGYI